MRQLLMNMDGVVVARMPRPSVQRGMVLIRVRYSLISVGTEIAPLRPASVSAPDETALERHLARARLARHYFRASLRDPRKAARRLSQIAERRLSRLPLRHRTRGRRRRSAGDFGSQRPGMGHRLLGRGRGRRGRRRDRRSPSRRSRWLRPAQGRRITPNT